MKTKILFTISFAIAAVQLFAQVKPYTVDQYTAQMRDVKIDFVSPKGFTESTVDIKDLINTGFYVLPSDACLAMLSKDNECLVAYSSLFRNILVGAKEFPDTTTTFAQARAILTRSRIAEGLRKAYGQDINLNDYLTVNSGEKAEEQFNVDSVYIYAIPLENENLKPYTHGISLTMMRRPVHMVGIYLLLTDKGYKKVDKYLSEIEGTIRFRGDPRNYKEIDRKPSWSM